jgi:probable F420-dependent oxidoreductase
MPDHFSDQLAPVPALMSAADATQTLRVGALVWDNDFRHPAVLAKELATIDLLSDGRLEIGLGAGWMIADYEQTGIPYESPGVRIDKMVEGLAVMRALFADGPVQHKGLHYVISGLEGLPKPVQQPHPPILIGGGGKRVLHMAAREADIVGINGTLTAGVIGPQALESMTEEAVERKVRWVHEAAGDRDIEMNVRAFFVSVTNDRAGTLDAVARSLGQDPAAVGASPFALIGSPAQLAEDLRERRDRWGFSYIIVGTNDVDEFAPVVAELAGT